jgi:short-subunit dehydrogenase
MNEASTNHTIQSDDFAIVTGASSGIGQSIALELGSLPMKVVLVGRRLSALEETARAITEKGGEAIPFSADLAQPSALEEVASQLVELTTGKLRVLVHSAGQFRREPLCSVKQSTFEELFRLNLWAPLALNRHLLPSLQKRGGDIVFINSSAALAPSAEIALYAASKSALKTTADALRKEINSTGIRVLSVYPGRTATPMQEAIFAVENRSYQPENLLQPEEVATMVRHAVLLPASAELTDLNIRPALAS